MIFDKVSSQDNDKQHLPDDSTVDEAKRLLHGVPAKPFLPLNPQKLLLPVVGLLVFGGLISFTLIASQRSTDIRSRAGVYPYTPCPANLPSCVTNNNCTQVGGLVVPNCKDYPSGNNPGGNCCVSSAIPSPSPQTCVLVNRCSSVTNKQWVSYQATNYNACNQVPSTDCSNSCTSGNNTCVCRKTKNCCTTALGVAGLDCSDVQPSPSPTPRPPSPSPSSKPSSTPAPSVLGCFIQGSLPTCEAGAVGCIYPTSCIVSCSGTTSYKCWDTRTNPNQVACCAQPPQNPCGNNRYCSGDYGTYQSCQAAGVNGIWLWAGCGTGEEGQEINCCLPKT